MDKSIDEKWSYYFCYDDMRVVPSLLAKAELLGNSRGWSVSLSGYSEYENAGKAAALPEPAQRVSFYAGQVFLDVSFRGSSAEYAGVFGNIAGLVRSFAASFGDLSGFESVEATHPNIRFRVEYFKISDAENIIDATADKPRTIDRLAIKAMELTENLSPGHPSTVFPNDFEEEAQYKWISPTGRTAFVADEHGNSIAVPGPYVVNKAMPWATQMPQFPTGYDRERFLSEPMPQTPFSGFYAPYTTARAGSMPRDATNGLAFAGNASTFGTHAEPQTVDTMKIAQGQDCRTTIMLRNIPNRMTCHELKHVLDQSSHGRYDFSYLRIDFKKGTNVGYAFVNFANPVDIIPFVSMWYGVPWQPHGKRQVELSYATVQGYDCLVEKFRNSAVMSEAPDYRPKLWYTVDTAPSPELIGQEAPFPPSNNASKRQRSHDNAGQIGLYTPNSGNHGRDRGRHSHFDRGTPAQLQEEAMFYGQATQAIKFAQPWY
ncbi:hypothetical protein K470DRAFT_144463 [Piedraia hortae CBS 480.64]|uniref:RRM domain-containing protein n=1 Tax=Piedraia hortae CBS 480.64 TaxID=1314780 RepID=A0A6A7BUK6_9PEZI|nr:hypothetical protein K470DRAFT_144463 [Piedraia hortae CBS 480.64]